MYITYLGKEFLSAPGYSFGLTIPLIFLRALSENGNFHYGYEKNFFYFLETTKYSSITFCLYFYIFAET